MMTKRIRVLVAIDEEGHYHAFGGSNADGVDYTDEDCREYIFLENVKEGNSYVWIEADVPIPKPETIEASVAGIDI